MAIYKDVEPLEVVAYKGESEDFDRGVTFILEQLDALPTADVAEVKHGEWIYKTTYGQLDECNCSLCGQLMTTLEGERMSYCCRCGAKMDGGARNGTIY